jgi:uncharacterized phiE125 gp8 family phage protein
MTLILVSGPVVEPATVAEVKLDARIDSNDFDSSIATLIQAARETAESLTGRAFITQTWQLVLDAFPVAEIKVGKLPIQSIASITYVDTSGATQTIDPSDYTLDAVTGPGWVLPAAGYSWPATFGAANTVRVTFVTGYGDLAEDVPAGLRSWIRASAAQAIQQQTNPSEVTVKTQFVDRLLDQFRVYGI